MNNASNPDDGSGSMSMAVGVVGTFRAICGQSAGVVKFARSVGL